LNGVKGKWPHSRHQAAKKASDHAQGDHDSQQDGGHAPEIDAAQQRHERCKGKRLV